MHRAPQMGRKIIQVKIQGFITIFKIAGEHNCQYEKRAECKFLANQTNNKNQISFNIYV